MLTVRAIPCLLLRDWGLEKSIQFQNPIYVGSPLNAARVFSDLQVDELILLDVGLSESGCPPRTNVISQIAAETRVPLVVGGGIRTVDHAVRLIRAGADRVAINSAAAEDPEIVSAIARELGQQAVVGSIDVRRQGGRFEVWSHGGTRATGIEASTLARRFADAGAGEILLTSIDQDGTMGGYDLELVSQVADAVPIPVIACGGAGGVHHFGEAVAHGAAAVAAGAFFLFFGPRRTVLLTYPTTEEFRRFLPSDRVRSRSNS